MENLRSILHSNSIKLANILRKDESRRLTLPLETAADLPSIIYSFHQCCETVETSENKHTRVRDSGPTAMDASLSIYVSSIQDKKNNKGSKPTVMYLDFSNNSTLEKSFLKPLKTFENLQVFSLSNTGLKSVPKTILKMHGNLEYLDLSYNFISEIPTRAKWSHIRGINLRHNRFFRWPDAVTPAIMPDLEFIDISHNTLTGLIPEDMVFEQLKHIGMSYCSLTKFPSFIQGLISLKSIDISGNHDLQHFTLHDLDSALSLVHINLQGVRILETATVAHFPPNLIIAKYCPNFKRLNIQNILFIM
ncbi:Leucine Rich Repeat family protein [Trichomonas vaginalis G3]|uniref:Leucine Rich Repeat family protein n=1 Tax=Trichomonas vaginalis (strain ATCC PRA-98 / G3) TaxID=412133 RepID=A2DWL8_TRIV3|nr:uncharacterized protein TVAGG3_0201800 [Trichomonas vaginalis G3]EAY15203.1 Leucine Rich Repeat family protein [Trichomonas vaginalis G3]KAI5550643.1 ribonuclease inhibitor domain-containing protein [Trichomonas vaginalis G3]|eukprot:XP_001327426.1 hypothetical protein [Trichomonas vaginalis G3]